MSDTLSLFEQPELDEHWTPPAAQPLKVEKMLPDLPLDHPYARYGLAVALYGEKLQFEELNEANLRDALANAIESGLDNFRMHTLDEPLLTRELHFVPVKLSLLRQDNTLVQSSGLAAQGIYIYPSVLTTDGNAKDTFKNAEMVLAALRGEKKSEATQDLSRSFAPTTAKINNGSGSQTPPKGTLIEAACALVTTLTPLKPAAWPGQNTVIIPELPLSELRDFIELFEQMSISKIGEDLMLAKLPPLPKTPVIAAKKKASDAKPKSEFRRPRLHGGNYPFAPRDAAVFGAVGLLGAIGRWAQFAGQKDWAAKVLESLAEQPLYIVSYDKISQARFGHHVVQLSLEGRLSELLDALWQEARLYSDIDSARVNQQNPAYLLFYLQTSRWLQQFSPASFRDFLAARAEYPALIEPVLREFFLQKHMNIPLDVVNSAGALGQWLNRTAYFVADGEVEANASDRRGKVQKTKAKILVDFESAAMSAKDPVDMLFRVSTRAGRLLQTDMPAEAKRFMDAVASGEINQNQAVWLLVAYMRIRSTPKKEAVSDEIAPVSDEELASDELAGEAVTEAATATPLLGKE